MSTTPLANQPRYTYGDYRRWNDDRRRELIDGIVYDMTPAPSVAHQDVLGALHVQVRPALGPGPCRTFLAPFDVRLPRGDEADDAVDTVVQPDLVVFCDPARLDAAGGRGAPDWVVEILSPSTAAKDQVTKRDLYERRGVREYWLVHPLDQVVTVYRLEGRRYGPPQVLAAEGETAVAAVPAVTIRWGEIFPPTPPNPGPA